MTVAVMGNEGPLCCRRQSNRTAAGSDQAATFIWRYPATLQPQPPRRTEAVRSAPGVLAVNRQPGAVRKGLRPFLSGPSMGVPIVAAIPVPLSSRIAWRLLVTILAVSAFV